MRHDTNQFGNFIWFDLIKNYLYFEASEVLFQIMQIALRILSVASVSTSTRAHLGCFLLFPWYLIYAPEVPLSLFQLVLQLDYLLPFLPFRLFLISWHLQNLDFGFGNFPFEFINVFLIFSLMRYWVDRKTLDKSIQMLSDFLLSHLKWFR